MAATIQLNIQQAVTSQPSQLQSTAREVELLPALQAPVETASARLLPATPHQIPGSHQIEAQQPPHAAGQIVSEGRSPEKRRPPALKNQCLQPRTKQRSNHGTNRDRPYDPTALHCTLHALSLTHNQARPQRGWLLLCQSRTRS